MSSCNEKRLEFLQFLLWCVVWALNFYMHKKLQHIKEENHSSEFTQSNYGTFLVEYSSSNGHMSLNKLHSDLQCVFVLVLYSRQCTGSDGLHFIYKSLISYVTLL